MNAKLHRAVVLTLTLIVALAAVVPPACAAGFCCARDHETSLHAQMPCCESQPSFAPPDTTGVQRAPLAGTFVAPQLVAPVAIAMLTPAISVAVDTTRDEEPAPPPPPFLLNAQFRI